MEFNEEYNLLQPWMGRQNNKSIECCCRMLLKKSLVDLYKCMGSTCWFTTSNRYEMENHLASHNSCANVLRCAYCSVAAKSPHLLVRHVQEYHGQCKYQCLFCFYRAFDAGNVTVHVFNHHKKQKDCKRSIIVLPSLELAPNVDFMVEVCSALHNRFKLLDCNVCNLIFVSISLFSAHLESHENPSFDCPVCQKSVKKKFVKAHLNFHRSKQYGCVYCERTFSNKMEMHCHLSDVHASKAMYCRTKLFPSNDKQPRFVLDNVSLDVGVSKMILATYSADGTLVLKPVAEEQSATQDDNDLPKIVRVEGGVRLSADGTLLAGREDKAPSVSANGHREEHSVPGCNVDSPTPNATCKKAALCSSDKPTLAKDGQKEERQTANCHAHQKFFKIIRLSDGSMSIRKSSDIVKVPAEPLSIPSVPAPAAPKLITEVAVKEQITKASGETQAVERASLTSTLKLQSKVISIKRPNGETIATDRGLLDGLRTAESQSEMANASVRLNVAPMAVTVDDKKSTQTQKPPVERSAAALLRGETEREKQALALNKQNLAGKAPFRSDVVPAGTSKMGSSVVSRTIKPVSDCILIKRPNIETTATGQRMKVLKTAESHSRMASAPVRLNAAPTAIMPDDKKSTQTHDKPVQRSAAPALEPQREKQSPVPSKQNLAGKISFRSNVVPAETSQMGSMAKTRPIKQAPQVTIVKQPNIETTAKGQGVKVLTTAVINSKMANGPVRLNAASAVVTPDGMKSTQTRETPVQKSAVPSSMGTEQSLAPSRQNNLAPTIRADVVPAGTSEMGSLATKIDNISFRFQHFPDKIDEYHKSLLKCVSRQRFSGINCFVCGATECKERFPTSFDLRNHMLVNHRKLCDRHVECKHCHVILFGAPQYVSHLFSHMMHKFVCFMCPYFHFLLNVVVKHMAAAHNYREFQLSFAHPQRTDIVKDMVVVIPVGLSLDEAAKCVDRTIATDARQVWIPIQKNPSYLYQCGFCQHIAESKESLLKHIIRCRLKNLTYYPCAHCGMRLRNWTRVLEAVTTHLLYHGENLYQCSLCSYRHYLHGAVVSHMKTHHQTQCNASDVLIIRESVVDWKCNMCPFQTKFKQRILEHMMGVHKLPSVRFWCTECKFGVHTKVQCVSHYQTVHAGSKLVIVELYSLIGWQNAERSGGAMYDKLRNDDIVPRNIPQLSFVELNSVNSVKVQSMPEKEQLSPKPKRPPGTICNVAAEGGAESNAKRIMLSSTPVGRSEKRKCSLDERRCSAVVEPSTEHVPEINLPITAEEDRTSHDTAAPALSPPPKKRRIVITTNITEPVVAPSDRIGSDSTEPGPSGWVKKEQINDISTSQPEAEQEPEREQETEPDVAPQEITQAACVRASETVVNTQTDCNQSSDLKKQMDSSTESVDAENVTSTTTEVSGGTAPSPTKEPRKLASASRSAPLPLTPRSTQRRSGSGKEPAGTNRLYQGVHVACYTCESVFPSNEALQAHHQGEKGRSCRAYRYRTLFRLVPLVRCFYCNKSGAYAALKEHCLASHARKLFICVKYWDQLKCGLCPHSFDGEHGEEYVNHFRLQHRTDGVGGRADLSMIEGLFDWALSLCAGELYPVKKKVMKYICNHCNETFQNEKLLGLHVAQHWIAFACPYCEQKFKLLTVLHYHLLAVHQTDDWKPMATVTNDCVENMLEVLMLFPNGLVLSKREARGSSFASLKALKAAVQLYYDGQRRTLNAYKKALLLPLSTDATGCAAEIACGTFIQNQKKHPMVALVPPAVGKRSADGHKKLAK